MNWIEEREQELKKLDKDVEIFKSTIIGIEKQITNREEEIRFIEGLQRRDVTLADKETGKAQLETMKKELQEEKNRLEKQKEELALGAKVIERDNLRKYVSLAKMPK